jgi:integrase
MPTPTPTNPLAQVEWLFDQRAVLARSKAAKDNFRNSKSHFLAFLKESVPADLINSGYSVNREFDDYILLRFKQYVDDKNFSSSHTATILSAARQTITTAIANQWIKLMTFIDFSLPEQNRETDARSPYSASETTAILRALNNDIHQARRLMKPYVKTGAGRAPDLIPDGQNGTRIEYGWWTDEDNMRWYFETQLNCFPITGADASTQRAHKRFLTMATNRHGGLHELYRRWGVSAWTGPEVILPYVYKLVAETGLNPAVALALRLDDYHEEHPLTRRPYIRYWKERGSGEGELHVDLIGSGILALDEQQSRAVKRIWEEVSAHTASFRDQLPPDKRERLFVYQSRGVKTTGAARDFLMDAKTLSTWATSFVARHQLKSAQGKLLTLTLARFRPSLVSRMLKRGVDIYVIKSILGHSSIMTTLRYIESYDFAPKARQEVQKAISNIRENRRQQQNSPKPVANVEFEENKMVFATPLALCKNVFNPPDNIRKAANIRAGSPCSLFNMCLRCPNVLIMEEHLPQLFALRRQYLVALDQGLSATTHRAAIQQNLHILNSLLDEDKSDWSADILAEAERRSEFIDLVTDPVTIRGVNA